MNPAMQEILQYVLDHPEMTTLESVESYFDQFLWSIEKQEWDVLTDRERQLFGEKIDAAKDRPLKVLGIRDYKPMRE